MSDGLVFADAGGRSPARCCWGFSVYYACFLGDTSTLAEQVRSQSKGNASIKLYACNVMVLSPWWETR